MLIALWSHKGGQGVSVTSAMLALRAAHNAVSSEHVRLVDLCGDQPAIFGSPEGLAGVGEWSNSALGADTLDRSLEELTPNLALMPKGQNPIAADRAEELVEHLKQLDTPVVVDAGTFNSGRGPVESPGEVFRRTVVAGADKSVLVTRACYLSLRRTVNTPIRADAVVLVTEAGRALTRSDCERAIGAPVVATIAIDPDVARAVDAGMLRTRVPKGPIRSLGNLMDEPGDPTPTAGTSPQMELD